MNAVPSSAVRGAYRLRFSCNLITAPKPKTRVAVFGSFMGGCYVLEELLAGPLAEKVEVGGVASDDPTQPFTHPTVRLWKYPHTRDDELLVPRLARQHGLPLFTGRVKSPEFWEMFSLEWRPDLCLMATYGQKIPNNLIGFPELGFYNFHHSADTWPSYPGPDPIAAMVRDGRKDLVLTIHEVTSEIDGGAFVARSHPVPIPEAVNAIQMHRITWPQMGPFIRRQVEAMLEAVPASAEESLQLYEEPVPYRVARRPDGGCRPDGIQRYTRIEVFRCERRKPTGNRWQPVKNSPRAEPCLATTR